MFMNFLRNNVYASGILTVLRVYLGWKWLTGGWGKITGEPFNAGGYLNGAINNPVMSGENLVYPTYVSFLENIAIPNAGVFSFMVAWGEFLVGLGLILGILTTAAAFFGVVMNFSFIFAGTISTNPWMILIAMFVLAAGANAGKFGGDYYVLPYLKQLISGKKAITHQNKAA
ncbi:DoxX family protein [Anaerobacillus sp. CMMVII]|uniref:DoxX family protein n=1 Tax=Anaerobacillus sp. CMMVII TaxID=2755588 RepID=UPI0021B78AC0|nr:DoxX family protein [Anaerobacillus sp. CMMVII]MCT8139280.1 DoxX family protein [Anaerobacillus sp. CMMVII]